MVRLGRPRGGQGACAGTQDNLAQTEWHGSSGVAASKIRRLQMQASGRLTGWRERFRARRAASKQRTAEGAHRMTRQRQDRESRGKSGDAERKAAARDFGDPWGGSPL